jgi:hypothetical protein
MSTLFKLSFNTREQNLKDEYLIVYDIFSNELYIPDKKKYDFLQKEIYKKINEFIDLSEKE